MDHIARIVTPIPEWITRSHEIVTGISAFDILNTVIALGTLIIGFYMFYSFSKYGKYGRDVSQETQDHDRESLENLDLIEPADHIDHDVIYPNTAKNQVREKVNASKPTTKIPPARHNSVKKEDI